MKVFIDTNVLQDVLRRREPFCHGSQLALSLFEHFLLTGYVSTLSFCTIAYVLRKFSGKDVMIECMRKLRGLVKSVDLPVEVLVKSLSLSKVDF